MSDPLRRPRTLGLPATLDYILRFPWCRPTPDAPGAASAAGHTVGVTVGCRALYELGPGIEEVALAPDCVEQERRAARLAAREVGVGDPRWIERRAHVGARLIDVRDFRYQPIEGPSLGLPFFLAHVSVLLDVPLPVDVAATGALSPEGNVQPVDGVPAKLALLEETALAVRRVLVPHGVAIPEHVTVAVIPVRSVGEALRAVFPDLEERLRQRWSTHAREAELAAHRLHRVAIVGGMPEWGGVRQRAGWLREVVPSGSLAALQIEHASAIAHRHSQVDGEAPEWPDALIAAEAWRPFRMQIVAHAVQAAADHDDETARLFASRARELVREARERATEDAILLGAIGRALASAGDLESAAAVLDEALDTWVGLEELAQSSRALCERLRIAGVLRDAGAVRRLAELAAEVRSHPALDATSDAFVRLAVARAHLDAGDPAAALGLLDPPRWDEAPPHAASAATRCLVRALRELGQGERAEQVRSGLVAEPWRSLSALDAAVASAADATLELATLREDPTAGREVCRVLARCPPTGSPALFLSQQFRY